MTTEPLEPLAAARLDPMVPYLTGVLMGLLSREGREFMKLVDLQPRPPDHFRVRLASGLVLRVCVSAEPADSPGRGELQ